MAYNPVGKNDVFTETTRMLGETPINESDNGYVSSKGAEEAIPFGYGLMKGTANDQAKVFGSASGVFIGVAAVSTDATGVNDDGVIDSYDTGDIVAVKESGFINVYVEEAVNPFSTVRIRHTDSAGSAGYQEWGFSTTTTGASASGLANDTTAYTCIVVVDGVAIPVSIVGSAAQTITNVLSTINTDLGSAATATVASNKIKITSATTGDGSTVSIQDTDLFATLTNAKDAAEDAVPGSNDSNPVTLPGHFLTTVSTGKTAVVSGVKFAGTTTGAGIVALELGGRTSFAITADA